MIWVGVLHSVGSGRWAWLVLLFFFVVNYILGADSVSKHGLGMGQARRELKSS